MEGQRHSARVTTSTTLAPVASIGLLAVVAMAAAVVVVGGACSKPGTSIVRVLVDTRPSLTTPPTEVEIVVGQAGTRVVAQRYPWSTVNDFGIRLPAGVTGTVMVSAIGYDPSSFPTQVGTSERAETVAVKAGGVSAPVTLYLIPVRVLDPADGGAGGADASASGGGPGSGGATPGTGGASASTGGAGGGTASGGAMASGGATASGGAAGGRGGTPGTGGAGGSSASLPTWRGEGRPHDGSLLQDTQPAVAVDGAGNVVVAYLHGASIWANKFSAATATWGMPAAVDGRAGGDAGQPSIAVDKNGTYLAVWFHRFDNPMHGIWQSTSADGVTWAAPTAITSSGTAAGPVMAMNRDGVAVAAWTDTIGGSNVTMTGSVRSGGMWGTPHVLLPATDNGDRTPSVAVTGGGAALVAWEQSDGGAAGKTSAWMARYTADTGWGAAALLESYDADQAFSVNVAANNAGQAIFTWVQYTSSTAELWARRMGADGVLLPAVRAGEGTNIGWYPSPAVTLDESGTATVAAGFQVQGKYNTYVMRAPWSTTATVWPDPLPMESDNGAANDGMNLFEWSVYPQLGSDAAGNVVLIWRKRTGARFDLWARRFSAGTWGPPALIEKQATTASVVIPSLAVGSGGVAAAAWVYYAELQIWANILR